MTPAQIEALFTYHPPKEGQPKLYEELRNIAKTFAHHINTVCPESREKSIAITHLQNTIMWANASIAIHG